MDLAVLIYVLIIIAFAKMFGEIASRFNQPSVVGELLAGIVLGPFLLGQVFSSLNAMYTDQFLKDLADLGILLLMLYVGLEFSPKRLSRSSKEGIEIAVMGIIIPMFLGLMVGMAFGYSGTTLAFISVAVSVTALPVTIRILKDLEVVRTKTASRIISASLITDITLLFVMAIIFANQESGFSSQLAIIIVGFIVFLACAVIFGRYVVPQIYKLLKWMRTGEAAFALAIGIAILFAILADMVGLPTFVGAFIAGMVIGGAGSGLKIWARVEDILSGVTLGFLAPIFFVLIGFTVDFGAVFGGSVVIVLLFFSILAIAIAGKLLGSFIPAKLNGMSKEESMAIASMMMGKGAMELVFAQLAYEQGIIQKDVFSILVLMAFISTALAPILFKHFFNKAAEAGKICVACDDELPDVETTV